MIGEEPREETLARLRAGVDELFDSLPALRKRLEEAAPEDVHDLLFDDVLPRWTRALVLEAALKFVEHS